MARGGIVRIVGWIGLSFGTLALGACTRAEERAGEATNQSRSALEVPGLVAAYSFDEAAGSVLHDVSGHSNDGALSGQAWIVGKYGTGLQFDGNFVTVPDSASLDLTTEMTLSAWVRPLVAQSLFPTIALKETTDGLTYALYGGTWGPEPGFCLGGSGESDQCVFAGNVPQQTWTHLAATFDGSVYRLYIDGELAGSLEEDMPAGLSSEPLRIGGNTIWDEFFRGVIDELRVYSRALTPTEIQADLETPLNETPDTTPPVAALSSPAEDATVSGVVELVADTSTDITVASVKFFVDGTLLAEDDWPPFQTSWDSTTVSVGAHVLAIEARDTAGNTSSDDANVSVTTPPTTPIVAYAFDEGEGTSAADASGNLNDGTLLYEMWSPSGKHGGAASFDGIGQWITVDANSSLNLTTAMTLEAWVRPTATLPTYATVVMKEAQTGEAPSGFSYVLYASDTPGGPGETPRPHTWITTQGQPRRAFADALPADQWTHLASTYDNETLTLYVDGSVVATTPVQGPIDLTTGPLRIGGGSPWGGELFEGLLDDLRVYNRALTAAEIADDMATPVTPTAPDDCTGTNPDDGNPCTTDACDPSTGVTHTPVAAGTSCADTDACNGTETCDSSGTCVEGTAVTCTALDHCHDAGTCNTSTGVCSNPAKTDGTACSDSDACTAADACQAGTCISGAAVATDDGNPCTEDTCSQTTGVSHTAVAAGTSCSDGNACNGSETCNASASCVSGTPVTCIASDQCHDAGTCNTSTGLCSNPTKTNGAVCSDDNACTESDTCQAGTCTSGPAVATDDSNPCTTDVCNPTTGVGHTAVAVGTSCSDANACNGAETCDANGTCVAGTPVSCVADQCRATPTCNPSTGACSASALPDGTVCSDANACTRIDVCTQGVCAGGDPEPAGNTCDDDDNICNGIGICDGQGACVPAAYPIDDGNPCTNDICDPLGGVTHAPLSLTQVDDGDPCTQDLCQADIGIYHVPDPGSVCGDDDDDICNGAYVCDEAGTCSTSLSLPEISDGDPCTLDSCETANGIVHDPESEGATCGDHCIGFGSCDTAGTCIVATPPDFQLDDDNPCTTDFCNFNGPKGAYEVHQLLSAGTICGDPDSNPCNGEEMCTGMGQCVPSGPPNLDDGNPCTEDVCYFNEVLVGIFHPNLLPGTLCDDDDDNACNGVIACDGLGSCNVPRGTDDGNPCTIDSCDATGIHNDDAPAGTTCDDGDACNGAETCDGFATCTAGAPLVVADGNSCTTDSCDPTVGVTHISVIAGTICSDDGACNGVATCDGSGTCVPGTEVNPLDDDNPCTNDVCEPDGSTSHSPIGNGTPCDDANACTQGDTCQQGECAGGSAVVCADAEPCRQGGSCDPSTGLCSGSTPRPDGDTCEDGNPCTMRDTCQAGTCSPSGFAAVGHRCGDDQVCLADHSCVPLPQMLVLPPLDSSVPTRTADIFSSYYTGSGKVQLGVAASTIVAQRSSMIHGRVLDSDEQPISGVSIVVVGHPEFGVTGTLPTGEYNMVVNGGGSLTLRLTKPGYFAVDRTARSIWNDTVGMDDIVLTQIDPVSTVIDLSLPYTQEAFGSVVEDNDGVRQAGVVFSPGTHATAILPDGSSVPLQALTIHTTEYTVGGLGEKRMPAALPPTSAYTYALELVAEEAEQLGATSLHFDAPVHFYVDNFLGFPTGTNVPFGYYDRELLSWVPQQNGRVITVLGTSGGVADVDADGDDLPDSPTQLAALGLSIPERELLAIRYSGGTSLWRTEMDHFSPWDGNFGFGPPPCNVGGPCAGPYEGKPERIHNESEPRRGPCERSGSDIFVETQAVGASVDVAGTPFSLKYRSDGVPGYAAGRSVRMPATGPAAPGAITYKVGVSIAGKTDDFEMPPNSPDPVDYAWDGTDGHGRKVFGERTARIRVEAVFTGGFYTPTSSFGAPGTILPYPGYPDAARTKSSYFSDFLVTLSARDSRQDQALGGWHLNAHHVYDVDHGMLYTGEGERIHVKPTIRTVTPLATGFGGVHGLVVRPDGQVLVADGFHHQISQISVDGVVTLIAGSPAWTAGFAGDGGPATQARLNSPTGVAIAPDGSIFIADAVNSRIRRIDPNGIISTYAGNAAGCQQVNNGDPIGDGGPATSAPICNPHAVAVGPDGTLYFVDSNTVAPPERFIRYVDSAGIVHTVAGRQNGIDPMTAPPRVDALNLRLNTLIQSIAITPNGSIYIPLRNKLVRVDPDGSATPLTTPGIEGFDDGAFSDLNGSVYALGRMDGTRLVERILRIGVDGTPTVIAGGSVLSNASGFPATRVYVGGSDAAAGPDGNIYALGSLGVYKIGTDLRFEASPECAFETPGRGSREIYCFDETGRHLTTRDALTSASIYEFGYDATGALNRVTDGDSNVTTITRNANTITIQAPHGQETTIDLGSSGYARAFHDPTGEFTQVEHDAGGLLTKFTDRRGQVHSFSYDAVGRLETDNAPGTGSLALEKFDIPGGQYSVSATTALGAKTHYELSPRPNGAQRQKVTYPDGTSAESALADTGVETITYPNGTVVHRTFDPDPRWGAAKSYISNETITLPSGLTTQMSRTRTLQGTILHEAVNVNGATAALDYDTEARRFSAVLPTGRSFSYTLDSQGRYQEIDVPGLTPATMSYDALGRLSEVAQGIDRITQMEYYENGVPFAGYVQSITDPTGTPTTFVPDALGRVLNQSRVDQSTDFTWDPEGNLLAAVLPGGTTHAQTFTGLGRVASYHAPGEVVSSYNYDADRRLEHVVRPDGKNLDLVYDPTRGRIIQLLAATEQVSFDYYDVTPCSGCAPGAVKRVSVAGEESIDYTYDGPLLSSAIWSGPIQGTTAWGYDQNLRTASEIVSIGGSTTQVVSAYDGDGSLSCLSMSTCAIGVTDALRFTRDPETGLGTANSAGRVAETISYTGHGELARITSRLDSATIYDVVYDSGTAPRDVLGRVHEKIETLNGTTHERTYAYSENGELTDVFDGGAAISHYEYDANGNRTGAVTSSGAVAATYDEQDRLLTYGEFTFSYSQGGDVETRTNTQSNATMHFGYDARGNLKSVILPNGDVIQYLVDAFGRRIRKSRNGSVVRKWMYGSGRGPLVEVDAAGIVSRFVYGNRSNVPELMVRAGHTYRLITDQLGSVRLVVDIGNGQIAARMAHDEFGVVVEDTTPGFTPFGFGGGLYDPDTALVQFGARDYDPSIGRWLTKDPSGFGTSDLNLYAYVFNDPVNFVDPTGEDATSAALSFAQGFGGAVLGGVAVSALLATGTVVGGLAAVALIGYGSIVAGELLVEVVTGQDFWTRQPICPEDRVDKAAELLGGLVGGGLSGRGYVGKEPHIGPNARLALFGNRTDHALGKYPHYHRRVPDPAKPGGGLKDQGISRHRPFESRPTDKSFWDRF